jgi:hypothetical protein
MGQNGRIHRKLDFPKAPQLLESGQGPACVAGHGVGSVCGADKTTPNYQRQ